MQRPNINLPGWAPSDLNALVEPSVGRKTTGWQPNEPLPAQLENWLNYSMSAWLAYLASLTGSNVGDADAGDIPTLTPASEGVVWLLDSTADAFAIELPDPDLVNGAKFYFKDVGGALDTNPVTLERFDTENFEGVQQHYVLEAPNGFWTVWAHDGDWYLI